MKNVIQIWLFVCLVAVTSSVSAQSAITFDATQLYSSFKFNDSDNLELNDEYSGVFTGAYTLGYRYTADFGLVVRTGIGMRKAGATLVYDESEYSWKLQYLNAKLGIGYMYKTKRVNPYFVAYGYYSHLLQGSQTLNNEHFNIVESELLKRSDYGLIFAPGVELKFSELLSSYLEFNYLMGLQNIETDAGQTTKNYAYGVTLGLAFTFVKKEEE